MKYDIDGGSVMKEAPHSVEFSAHCYEIDFIPKLETLSDLIAEVKYCISKYTEDGFDNHKYMNEDYSWMPHCKAKIDYQAYQRQLKQELRELKNLLKYYKELV
jgi:hypothetical protein